MYVYISQKKYVYITITHGGFPEKSDGKAFICSLRNSHKIISTLLLKFRPTHPRAK